MSMTTLTSRYGHGWDRWRDIQTDGRTKHHQVIPATLCPCFVERTDSINKQHWTIMCALPWQVNVTVICTGSLQSLDWNGVLEWCNGMVEWQVEQKRGQL